MSSSAAAALVSAASAAGYRLTLLDDAPGAAPTPLMVLCGWFGAQDKHLAKYAELVNQLGCSTLRVQMPPATVFSLRTAPRRRFADALLRFLRTPGLLSPRRPLVLMYFSNGGAFVHEQLLAALREQPAQHAAVRAAHAGTAFDSAPAWLHAASGAQLFAHLAPFAALRPLFTACFRVALRVIHACRLRAGALPRDEEFWAAMSAAPPTRECYLYSADDPLCDVARLEGLIVARRAAGATVSAHRWEVSQHVGHLRCHPEAYRTALAAFLKAATR